MEILYCSVRLNHSFNLFGYKTDFERMPTVIINKLMYNEIHIQFALNTERQLQQAVLTTHIHTTKRN